MKKENRQTVSSDRYLAAVLVNQSAKFGTKIVLGVFSELCLKPFSGHTWHDSSTKPYKFIRSV